MPRKRKVEKGPPTSSDLRLPTGTGTIGSQKKELLLLIGQVPRTNVRYKRRSPANRQVVTPVEKEEKSEITHLF